MRPERRSAGAMTRDQWRLIITGYLILTMFWLIGAGWTYKIAKDNQRTLQGVKANQSRIQRAVVLQATLTCALGEGDEQSDAAVMDSFGHGFRVPSYALPPICIDVSNEALARVLGK